MFKAFTRHCLIIVTTEPTHECCFMSLHHHLTYETLLHIWLHHTVHCTEKTVSTRLRVGSASAEMMGQGDVGGVNCRVTCTWWLLGFALKKSWLGLGGPPIALTAWRGLQNTTLTLVSSKKACLGFERVYHKP